VALTEAGRVEAEKGFAVARRITEETLAPLSAADRVQLLALLKALS